MRHGFIRTAAVTPKIQVADTKGNGAETIRLAREAAEHGAKIIVFPEAWHYRLYLLRFILTGSFC